MSKHRTYEDKVKRLSQSRLATPLYAYGFESLIMIPNDNPRFNQFFGIARIFKISRGDAFDVITVAFGVLNKVRDILVTDNFARRQLLTLKKGQYALIFGEAHLVYRETTTGHKVAKWEFMSRLNLGMYVPKVADFKQHKKDIDDGIEVEQCEDISTTMSEHYKPIIDSILSFSQNDLVRDGIKADTEGDDYEY